MIIKSRHHFFYYPFFRIYTLVKIRLNFRKVIISGEFTEKGLPLLLISNHISWWDGIWVMFLNMKLFKRKFHFMMLEEQIYNFPVLNKVGGYSVRKGSRSIIETLNYTNELLSDNKNLVLMFPQGEIQSVYNQQIKFGKGLERILKDNSGTIQVVLIAHLIDYFSEAKPTVYIYFRELNETVFSLEAIEKKYNDFYSGCLRENISKSENQ
jgi:1-acyl-sn-glycerol-3-phosphate acyltransferase